MTLRHNFAAGAVACLGLIGSQAAAQTDVGAGTRQATFQGSAPAGCRMSAASAPTSNNAQVTALSAGSADIAIAQLVGDDGTAQAATIVLTLPAVCNQAHTLTLDSLRGALASDGPELTGGPFRNRLPYSVTVSWAGGLQSYSSQDDTLTLSVPNAATGLVTITIQIPSGGAPLAAGAYSDQLVLELGAAG